MVDSTPQTLGAIVFSLLKKAQHSGVRAGIAIHGEAAALVSVRRRPGQPPLVELAQQQPTSEALDLGPLLQRGELARAKVCVALNSEAYQLVQVEAPEVQPAELRAAVRWRLRDVIDFSIDEAVIDVFDIPDQSRRTQKMMFAIAARTAAVQAVASTVQRHARGFDAIDIPELCLRNVSALLPQDHKGVALLALGDRFGQLVITRQGILYLTRRIEFARRYDSDLPAASSTPDIDVESLALELQRSLDYYESHFDQPAIGDLVIAPLSERATKLAAALGEQTSLRIGVFNPEEILQLEPSVTLEATWLQLVALGAALRSDTLEL